MGNSSSNIKQRERLDKEGTPDDNIFVIPLQKSRKQELEDRKRQRDLAPISDIKNMTLLRGMSLVRTEEIQSSGDAQTTSSDELKKEKERYYHNRRSGNTYHVR